MTDLQRADLLLPKKLLQRLRRDARERKTSLSALVRETLERTYTIASEQERMAAAKRLTSCQGPVADWPQMKRQILRGFLG